MSKHRNTPELRFPEFKDEWKNNELGKLLSIISGHSPSYYSEGSEYPLYKVNDLNNNSKFQDYSDLYVEKKHTPLNKKVIIFPKRGAAILLNKIRIINTPGYIDTNLMGLEFNDVNDTEFYYYAILREGLYRIADTSTIPQINKKHILPYKIYSPSYIEKNKLGNFFSRLDRQIELEEEKLELLEQQKKGYMQKIFTQELKFEDSQLENIKWSYKTLEELNSFFTDGNYGESYPKSEDMSDKNDGVAFLRGSNLKKGRITLEDANYISKKKHSELTTGHLFLDDIVIAVRGSLGAVGYVNENIVGNNINSQLAIIRTSSSLLYGKYLLYYLMSNQGKKELLSRVTGTALKQLPIKQIKQIKVPVPKLQEQHKIANFLSELDNLIDNQTEKIELLKERKKGFLQKMFV
ncbi:restriction endonuclease subunit S [Staphylococcus haemolyticus]|uniref:restriction endonuclease subunit S n=1 Tax=Staphylococcus haemolyticus TaxID=1283 RepID=UPI000D1E07B3|nr:restriction endonuclease subunit S [Staphylococcus haemolyticus]PTK65102.1 restriction endonuclease subunit S [Staphylococcus haemolyticus]PTK81764.1 restriction endonuclease subunit S [Staphylococcus haemolyticus]